MFRDIEVDVVLFVSVRHILGSVNKDCMPFDLDVLGQLYHNGD